MCSKVLSHSDGRSSSPLTNCEHICCVLDDLIPYVPPSMLAFDSEIRSPAILRLAERGNRGSHVMASHCIIDTMEQRCIVSPHQVVGVA